MSLNRTTTGRQPIPVIIETDIFSDVDDVGALALAHGFADLGRAELLSIGVNTPSRYGYLAVGVINAFFDRSVPVGALLPTDESVFGHDYARLLATSYPRLLDDRPPQPAVAVHRRALAGADGGSVVIISLGFFDNLRALLDSGPDEISPLTGRELITDRVQHMVVMGGRFPRGWEYNLGENADLAASVLTDWPTMIDFLGFEVGDPVITGSAISTDDDDNVVGAAYRAYGGAGAGRQSWDPLTVHLALAEESDLFSWSPAGRVQLGADGVSTHVVQAGGPHRYAIAKAAPQLLAAVIDAQLERGSRRS